MDSLRYHNLDKLLELCSSGRIDMHEPIEVLNQSQTMRTEMTILKHFVILTKSDGISLIHILSKLRCMIKKNLQTLISKNALIRHYIENVISEWKSEISISELLNDGLESCQYTDGDMFDYEQLVDEIKCSQKGGKVLDDIEATLKERQKLLVPMTPDYSEQMKLRLSELYNECNSCVDRSKSHSVVVQSRYKAMDPHHLQILIDLSFKPKSSYLDYSSQFSENETFSVFLSQSNDLDIPDNIHTIFLNYLITLNMMKKEMNYINNSLKEVILFMTPKIETLGNLQNGFNYVEEKPPVPMDGHGLSDNLIITDTPVEDDSLDETVLGKIKQFTFFD